MKDWIDNELSLKKRQKVTLSAKQRKAGDIAGLVAIEVEPKTFVYVKPGTDPELVIWKYQNRHYMNRRLR